MDTSLCRGRIREGHGEGGSGGAGVAFGDADVIDGEGGDRVAGDAEALEDPSGAKGNGQSARIGDLGQHAHAAGREACPDVRDIRWRATAGVGGREDGIARLKERGVGRIQLHPVGDELQDALVADGKAEPRDEARAHLEQRASPDLAHVVDLVGEVGSNRTTRKRAIGEIDLRLVDIGESQWIVRLAVGTNVVRTARGKRRIP